MEKSSDNQYHKLAKNTLIFMLGTFGSKIISFLIIPLYTFSLTTEEFGIVDMLTTTVAMLIPFFTLSLSDAAIRFLAGKIISKEEFASNAFFVWTTSTIGLIALAPILNTVDALKSFVVPFIVLLILNCFNTIFMQYIRGIGKIREFAVNGILMTITTVTSNLLFLLVLKLGMQGYLYAIIISQAVSTIYIILVTKLWEQVKIGSVNKSIVSTLLKYSAPLIPMNLMFWIMSAGDRYVITFVLGASANGLYALAQKFPMIINLVYSVFMQAWQLSAIEESNNDKINEFYTNVFRVISLLMILSASAIILIARPIFENIFGQGYHEAWRFVPILIISNLFSAFTAFLGTIYTVTMNSKKSMITTAMGAVLNVIFNFIFIPLMGINGAGVGTMLSCMITALIRMKDTKKYVQIKYNYIQLILAMSLLVIQTLTALFIDSVFVYLSGVGIIVALLVLYRRDLNNVLNLLLIRFNEKKVKDGQS